MVVPDVLGAVELYTSGEFGEAYPADNAAPSAVPISFVSFQLGNRVQTGGGRPEVGSTQKVCWADQDRRAH